VLRLGIVSLLFSACLLPAGCGSSDETTKAADTGTWSVTVADNIGPQVGPNQPAALRAALQGYRDANHKEASDVSAQGCQPASGSLRWDCQVTGKRCAATVTVVFDGPHDSAGHVKRVATDCTGTHGKWGASGVSP
jgi:hypothetical protein